MQGHARQTMVHQQHSPLKKHRKRPTHVVQPTLNSRQYQLACKDMASLPVPADPPPSAGPSIGLRDIVPLLSSHDIALLAAFAKVLLDVLGLLLPVLRTLSSTRETLPHGLHLDRGFASILGLDPGMGRSVVLLDRLRLAFAAVVATLALPTQLGDAFGLGGSGAGFRSGLVADGRSGWGLGAFSTFGAVSFEVADAGFA